VCVWIVTRLIRLCVTIHTHTRTRTHTHTHTHTHIHARTHTHTHNRQRPANDGSCTRGKHSQKSAHYQLYCLRMAMELTFEMVCQAQKRNPKAWQKAQREAKQIVRFCIINTYVYMHKYLSVWFIYISTHIPPPTPPHPYPHTNTHIPSKLSAWLSELYVFVHIYIYLYIHMACICIYLRTPPHTHAH